VPAAFVVRAAGSSLTEPEFLEWVASQIANFKVPRHVVFATELPRNASMKVIKGELRAQARNLIPRP
jgi:acyl-coenzyme A synthetase/AMP-(fatty) acid ligase